MVVEQARLDELNKQIPGPFKLAVVPVEKLEFLEKNARYMKHETFRNLVENIKRDGGLSSVPFCMLTEEGKYRILSGNHRVKAAIEAGHDRVLVMYTDRPLSRQEQIAIQLSHNAIAGEDDPVILRELYNEIEDLSLKYYSGLDDKILEQLEKVEIGSLSDVHLEYRTVSFLFLPEERDRLLSTFERVKQNREIAGETVIARLEEYDRLLDAQAKTQAAYNIHNAATALMLILDVFERHQEDLQDGWLDEEGNVKHKGWVPLSSVLGTDMVPAEAARVIREAVEKMVSKGEVTAKNRWQALEYWAAEYLGGE